MANYATNRPNERTLNLYIVTLQPFIVASKSNNLYCISCGKSEKLLVTIHGIVCEKCRDEIGLIL